jgi:hypothetical protein
MAAVRAMIKGKIQISRFPGILGVDDYFSFNSAAKGRSNMKYFQLTVWMFVLLFFQTLLAPPNVQAAGKSKVPPSSLFLAKVKNKVAIVHGGKKHTANPPEPLTKDDRIVTEENSKAYLEFLDGGIVEVGPQTDTTVSQLEVTPKTFKARFLLAWGKMKAKVKKLTSSSSSFEVQAGGVVAGVRGTVFGVDYDKDQNRVNTQTFDGSIFTQAGGKEQIVEKGFSMVVGKTGLPIKSPLSEQQMNNFRDFMDVSGQLEKKKNELIQQMQQKVLDQVPAGLGGHVEDAKKVLDLFH